MEPRSRYTFLALILAQAAHSIEEYAFRLYDVFAPARFVSSLFSEDLTKGFATFNVALVLFGLWCYVVWIRPGRPSARFWAWLWTLLELGNGIGHPAIALARGGYFPGVVTAPVLFILAAYLASQLLQFQRHPVHPGGDGFLRPPAQGQPVAEREPDDSLRATRGTGMT